VGGEIFLTRPDRPWGPLSLLYNGYRVFLGDKAAGAWRWPPTPSNAEVKERVELYLYLPSGLSWPVIGWTLPLLLLLIESSLVLSVTGDYQSELILVFYTSYIKTLNYFTRVNSVEFPMTNSGFLAQLFLVFLRVQKAGFLFADWRQRDASPRDTFDLDSRLYLLDNILLPRWCQWEEEYKDFKKEDGFFFRNVTTPRHYTVNEFLCMAVSVSL
jgi:hypothetical protein